MPTIDTSNANAARVLRESAARIDALASKDIRKSFSDRNFAANEARVLADALDALPSVTWEERTERARKAFYDSYGTHDTAALPAGIFGQDIPAALAAAFPEFAPANAATGSGNMEPAPYTPDPRD